MNAKSLESHVKFARIHGWWMLLAVLLAMNAGWGCAPQQPTLNFSELNLPATDSSVVAQALARDEPTGRDRWQQPEVVLAALAPLPGKTVVDVGAGTGYFTRHLLSQRRGPARIIALESDSVLLRYLRAALPDPRLQLRSSHAALDGLAPGEADRLLMVQRLGELAEPEALLRALLRSLRPDGWLLVVEPRAAARPPEAVSLAHAVSTADAIRMLQRAGFRSFAVDSTLLPYHYMLRAQ